MYDQRMAMEHFYISYTEGSKLNCKSMPDAHKVSRTYALGFAVFYLELFTVFELVNFNYLSKLIKFQWRQDALLYPWRSQDIRRTIFFPLDFGLIRVYLQVILQSLIFFFLQYNKFYVIRDDDFNLKIEMLAINIKNIMF